MIKVFTAENRLQVFQIKELLEAAGIPCFVKNEYAIGGAGEIAPFDAWPEVWLADDAWQKRAQRVIDEFRQSNQARPSWVCKECGERNEGNFEICWQCGYEPD